MAAKKAYNADSITVLEGLDAVRKRPGMYIGSTSRKGLNHLVYEIVDNSVDEHLAGYCSEIRVTLNDDGSATISDLRNVSSSRHFMQAVNLTTTPTVHPEVFTASALR